MVEVRTFIAVKLDDSLHGLLYKTMDHLKGANADVRWLKSENIHITVKFLGNVEEERLGEIEQAMKKSVKGHKPFELTICGLGLIPNPRYPRVVYTGITGGVEEMKKINQAIEDGLLDLGFHREPREFLPHITLGRVKSFRGKSPLIMKMREFQKKEIGSMMVNGLFLMKSELHPGGSIYTELANVTLA